MPEERRIVVSRDVKVLESEFGEDLTLCRPLSRTRDFSSPIVIGRYHVRVTSFRQLLSAAFKYA